MSLSVKDVLTPLGKPALVRLIALRPWLLTSGTKDQLRRRLTHSYRGDVDAALDELRREDLIVVGQRYSNRFDLGGLARLRVDDLRHLLRSHLIGVSDEGEPKQADAEDPGSDHKVELYLSGQDDRACAVGIRSS